MKKRFLTMFLLAMMLLFSTIPAAWAAETSGQCGENVYWRLENGTLTISGTGAMWDYKFKWEYKGDEKHNYVTNAPWGKYNEDVENIIIEQGVTAIGKNAFYNVNSARNLDIAGSVYTISDDAFSYCENFTDVEIPNGVKYIEKGAFAYCTNLQTITIPASVMRVEHGMFSSCRSLRDIIVDTNNTHYSSWEGALYSKEGLILYVYPAGRSEFKISDRVETISSSALYGCAELTEVIIPDNVTGINYGAFNNCSSLQKVVLPEFISDNWNGLFINCASLTEVILPEKLVDSTSCDKKHRFYNTFNNCINLSEIHIPENVNVLYRTFSGCENLETVYLPITLEKIEENTFYRCYNLKKVVYAGNEIQWGMIDIDESNVELADAEKVFLDNSLPNEPDNPDKPVNPDNPDKPDKPVDPDKPGVSEKPGVLPVDVMPGGLGYNIKAKVEGGHWLTLQVRRAGTIAITSVQAPGRGMVEMTFSAAVGSVVQIWETAEEMTFTNGSPNNKVLAEAVKNLSKR